MAAINLESSVPDEAQELTVTGLQNEADRVS